MESVDQITPINKSPYYRYGMLMVILALLAQAVWRLAGTPSTRRLDYVNLMVVGMLLVNHLAANFLSLRAQRRMNFLQWPFLAFCALYVFGSPPR
jgi:hypothetical protein